MTPASENNPSNLPSTLFEDIKRRFDERSKTLLNVVVCGPGPPDDMDPAHPFHLREAIKNLLTTNGDDVIYIEDLLRSQEGEKIMKEIESRLGYRPSLDEIELEILESTRVDKDVHLMERIGAILELRDFLESPVICKKMRIFVDQSHREKGSYVDSLIERLFKKGVKFYWYTDKDDLLQKVERGLIRNRVEKSRLQSR